MAAQVVITSVSPTVLASLANAIADNDITLISGYLIITSSYLRRSFKCDRLQGDETLVDRTSLSTDRASHGTA